MSKYHYYFFIRLFAVFAVLSIASHAIAKEIDRNAPPDDVVEYFYKEYLSAQELGVKESMEKSADLIARFTTQRLMEEVRTRELDSDAFTDAQDVMPEWIENVVVSKPTINDDRSYVIMTLGIHERISSYDIFLIKQHDVWKIDSVKLISRNSTVSE